MSYEFCYDYKREVLEFTFPDDQICITYYLNKRYEFPTNHYQVWFRVSTVKGSYPMRSYAFKLFQRCFRRIKCDDAKAEAKGIIRRWRNEKAKSNTIAWLLVEYEKEKKEALEKAEEEE